MFGLFKRSKNTVTNPRILIAAIGGIDNALFAEDREIYQGIFGDVTELRAKGISDFFDFIAGEHFDVLHLFAEIESGERIENTSGSQFFAKLFEAKPSIVIFANSNLGDNLMPFCSAGTKLGVPINLVMTLDRKGDSFPKFFKALFNLMIASGQSMAQAWVELAPQDPHANQPNVPETAFSTGLPVKFIT